MLGISHLPWLDCALRYAARSVASASSLSRRRDMYILLRPLLMMSRKMNYDGVAHRPILNSGILFTDGEVLTSIPPAGRPIPCGSIAMPSTVAPQSRKSAGLGHVSTFCRANVRRKIWPGARKVKSGATGASPGDFRARPCPPVMRFTLRDPNIHCKRKHYGMDV